MVGKIDASATRNPAKPCTRNFGSTTQSEPVPIRHVQSDQDILDWIRANAHTAYHPIGTCRMGTGSDCVVDPKLRVHG
ncbi:MAG: hypothetical protein EBW11_09075, partial [Betaproteobacteria bacterium]|nr:hypothetical protein [Betaproteobacteria bacterium]